MEELINNAETLMSQHIVGLSGGKDSTALALMLAEREPRQYRYIYTPTGNEPPQLFEHIKKLETLIGAQVENIGIGKTLYDIIREQKMIPNSRARFCTRILKIEPTIKFMEELPEGSVLYVGLRADEEERKGIYSETLTCRFPLREWGIDLNGVWGYLGSRGVSIPARTDCGVCYHQRLGEWWNLWRNNSDMYTDGENMENEIGYTFRSDSRDSWPASLKGLRERFEAGEVPRGADIQGELFEKCGDCRVCSL